MESIWTVIITEDVLLQYRRAHQEDDVGVLVKSSSHADSLPLTTAQVDSLNHNNTRGSYTTGIRPLQMCRAEISTEKKSLPALRFQFGPQRAKGQCQAAVNRRQSRPCTWNIKSLSALASSSTTEEEQPVVTSVY